MQDEKMSVWPVNQEKAFDRVPEKVLEWALRKKEYNRS